MHQGFLVGIIVFGQGFNSMDVGAVSKIGETLFTENVAILKMNAEAEPPQVLLDAIDLMLR